MVLSLSFLFLWYLLCLEILEIDLGLGILPGEGWKKIWASCLYILLYCSHRAVDTLYSLLIVSERNEAGLAKKPGWNIYPLRWLMFYYIKRQLYFSLGTVFSNGILWSLYLLIFTHIYSYLLTSSYFLVWTRDSFFNCSRDIWAVGLELQTRFPYFNYEVDLFISTKGFWNYLPSMAEKYSNSVFTRGLV